MRPDLYEAEARQYEARHPLWAWCLLCIIASYPMEEWSEASREAQRYVTWLDSLPVTS